METIEWITGLIPKSVRPLFAVLLIAISTMATIIVFFFNENKSTKREYEARIEVLNTEHKHDIDSLNRVIYQIKEDSKKEVVRRLEEIIEDQKKQIEERNNSYNKGDISTKKPLIIGKYKP